MAAQCCQRHSRHIFSSIALSQLCWRFTVTCYSLLIAAKSLHCVCWTWLLPSTLSIMTCSCSVLSVSLVSVVLHFSGFDHYLSDRSFRVVLSTSTSFLVHLFCSVPQGSVLGSRQWRMFILYMADLADVVQNCHVYFHSFADHSQIYLHCPLSGQCK